MAGTVYVTLGGRRLAAEVASSRQEQVRGLQGHAPLRDDEAMFFPYQRTVPASFHMGTVRFPIDILFLSKVGTAGPRTTYVVAKADRNIQPGDPSHFTYGATDAVLETRGGLTAGIAIGDRMQVEGHTGTFSYVRTAAYGISDTVEDATAPGGVDMPAPGNGRRSKHLDLAVGRPVNDSDVRGGPLNRAIARLERALANDP